MPLVVCLRVVPHLLFLQFSATLQEHLPMVTSSVLALIVAPPLLPRRQLTLMQTRDIVSSTARHWWTQAGLHYAMHTSKVVRQHKEFFKAAHRCEYRRELSVKAMGSELPFMNVSVAARHWNMLKSRISRAQVGQPNNSHLCSTAAPPCSGSKYILNYGAMGSMVQRIGCRMQHRRQRLSAPQHLTKPNATTAISQAVGRLKPFEL